VRECGPCTECCLGGLEVEVLNQKLCKGTKCRYVEDGCTIHEDRPKVCRDFMCGWVTDEKFPEELRPDICGAIVLRGNHVWNGMYVDSIVFTRDGELGKFEELYGAIPFLYKFYEEDSYKLGAYGTDGFKHDVINHYELHGTI
jgi:hypothetical protein